MQFSANIFQNDHDLPSRIKFKKKSSLFGESCDLGGPGPPPPETFRGVGGGRDFEVSPYGCCAQQQWLAFKANVASRKRQHIPAQKDREVKIKAHLKLVRI